MKNQTKSSVCHELFVWCKGHHHILKLDGAPKKSQPRAALVRAKLQFRWMEQLVTKWSSSGVRWTFGLRADEAASAGVSPGASGSGSGATAADWGTTSPAVGSSLASPFSLLATAGTTPSAGSRELSWLQETTLGSAETSSLAAAAAGAIGLFHVHHGPCPCPLFSCVQWPAGDPWMKFEVWVT